MSNALISTLGDFTPLPPPKRSTHRFLAELGGSGSALVKNFVMQTQEGSFWCWAATAASVARKYHPATAWSQCSIATEFYRKNGHSLNCCGSDKEACDQPQALSQVFAITRNLAGQALNRPVSFEALTAEMRNDRPVCIRIGWPPTGNEGHFIAVTGCRTGQNGEFYVDVQDPSDVDGSADNRKSMTFEELRSNYDLVGGFWNWTYHTKP